MSQDLKSDAPALCAECAPQVAEEAKGKLVLRIKPGESILIQGGIEVYLEGVSRTRASLYVMAPRSIHINYRRRTRG